MKIPDALRRVGKLQDGPAAAGDRADALTTSEELHAELLRLDDAGCDDLVLFPCSSGLEQVGLLAEALR